MADFLILLREQPALLVGCAAVLGLVVGSFLNVVILRLPRMLARDWRVQAREILEISAQPDTDDGLSLLRPGSSCPQCGHSIRAWQNIPVLSWLMLRGRCAHCATPIPLQYPVVEAASGVLTALCAWQFGVGAELVMVWLFTWILLAAAVIDLRTQLLPDVLTLPLMWLGLLINTQSVFASPVDAIIGAAAGYLSLWAVFHLFRLVTGREGMGYGDFKLLAACGAWLGWQALPMIILLSSLVGALVGIGMIVLLRHDRRVPIPFGPYLAAAGWLAFIYGDELGGAYRQLSGLT